VLGGDGDHLADRRLEGARRRTHNLRRAADDLHDVVIGVLVRHQQDVGLNVLDRGIVEAKPSLREPVHGSEGVDEDRALAADQEGRLPVPADPHFRHANRPIRP